MKLEFVDWKIEKEGFWDYGYRYYLKEIINEKDCKTKVKIVIATNDLSEVIKKIGELTLKNDKIEFKENNSLIQYRNVFIS